MSDFNQFGFTEARKKSDTQKFEAACRVYVAGACYPSKNNLYKVFVKDYFSSKELYVCHFRYADDAGLFLQDMLDRILQKGNNAPEVWEVDLADWNELREAA